MKKHNTRVTRTEQDRMEAALKRRAKRKEAKTTLLAPYRKLLIAKDEKIAELIRRVQDLASKQPVQVVSSGNQSGKSQSVEGSGNAEG